MSETILNGSPNGKNQCLYTSTLLAITHYAFSQGSAPKYDAQMQQLAVLFENIKPDDLELSGTPLNQFKQLLVHFSGSGDMNLEGTNFLNALNWKTMEHGFADALQDHVAKQPLSMEIVTSIVHDMLCSYIAARMEGKNHSDASAVLNADLIGFNSNLGPNEKAILFDFCNGFYEKQLTNETIKNKTMKKALKNKAEGTPAAFIVKAELKKGYLKRSLSEYISANTAKLEALSKSWIENHGQYSDVLHMAALHREAGIDFKASTNTSTDTPIEGAHSNNHDLEIYLSYAPGHYRVALPTDFIAQVMKRKQDGMGRTIERLKTAPPSVIEPSLELTKPVLTNGALVNLVENVISKNAKAAETIGFKADNTDDTTLAALLQAHYKNDGNDVSDLKTLAKDASLTKTAAAFYAAYGKPQPEEASSMPSH